MTELRDPAAPAPAEPSATQRLERCLAAIGAREPKVRAFRHMDIDAAKDRAAQLDAAGDGGALAGRVIGLADRIDTADMPTGYGSAIYASYRPFATAPVAMLALEAGANLLGKTDVAELGGHAPLATRHPHEPSHGCGGAAAAAVAAGMLDAGIDVQTGGAVIRSAALCGVVGFKPSFDLVPTVGVKTFAWTLDTVGVLASSVDEAARLATVLAGRALRPRRSGRPPRLGLFAPAGADDAAYAALARVRAAAEAAGAAIRDVTPPPGFAQLEAAWHVIHDWEGARSLRFEHDRHGTQMSDALRRTLDFAAALPEGAYEEALAVAAMGRAQLPMMMGGCDALLTLPARGRASLEGVAEDSRFNQAWTLLGTPAVALPVPGALRGEGLPLGVQVVAPRLADHGALSVAAWLEHVMRDAASPEQADDQSDVRAADAAPANDMSWEEAMEAALGAALGDEQAFETDDAGEADVEAAADPAPGEGRPA